MSYLALFCSCVFHAKQTLHLHAKKTAADPRTSQTLNSEGINTVADTALICETDGHRHCNDRRTRQA